MKNFLLKMMYSKLDIILVLTRRLPAVNDLVFLLVTSYYLVQLSVKLFVRQFQFILFDAERTFPSRLYTKMKIIS